MPLKTMLFMLILILTSSFVVAQSREVIVFAGPEQSREFLKAEQFWGTAERGKQMTVPRLFVIGVNPAWKEKSEQLPVADKKEIFFSAMVPLIMHANEMVMLRREGLYRMQEMLKKGIAIPEGDLQQLRDGLLLLRVADADTAAAITQSSEELPRYLEEMLHKADIIPVGIALGQAAYESGYATSRFAAEGNALFGQWTYGGKGLVPEQQRKSLGDHRIASFEWPFDSVRGYFLNLMSHPAYEDFRKLRAKLRAEGKPLSSMALADGLIKYSERGQEYVDGLKGIITKNLLDVADDAVFRDGPTKYLVGSMNEEAAAKLRLEFEQMQKSGEFEQMLVRMRLNCVVHCE
jgi:Bax protein